MAEAAARRDPLPNDQFGDRPRQVSARLWYLLITWCDGKAMGVI